MTTSTEDPSSTSVPDRHSSNLDLTLDPNLSAVVATVTILRRLFRVTLATEKKVRLDLHPDYLHDFRVSVRRTRSVLGQIKQVLPRDSSKHFRREFSWLARLTGPTRDLDVLLIKLPGYQAALSPKPSAEPDAGMVAVRTEIERLRWSEARSLAERMDTERYKTLLRDWPVFLESATSHAPEKNSLRPILEVAGERISRAGSRAADLAQAIVPSSPAINLHRLRIACKKLRYLLEFFRSLYSVSEVSEWLASLETLQDVLGELNDLSVQRNLLTELTLERDGPHGDASRHAEETLVAIEELRRLLEQLGSDERHHLRQVMDGGALSFARRMEPASSLP